MAAMGLTVEFLAVDGARTAPPPWPRPDTLAAPSAVIADPPIDENGTARTDDPAPAVAYIVPLDGVGGLGGAERPDGFGALIDAPWVLPELVDSSDVRQINAVASRVVMARAAELGSEARASPASMAPGRWSRPCCNPRKSSAPPSSSGTCRG